MHRAFFAFFAFAVALLAQFVPHVADLQNYDNILYDRYTLKAYIWQRPDGLIGDPEDEPRGKLVDTGYTFEAATWRGFFGNISHFQWPWLNPLGFATRETADKILVWCKQAAQPGGATPNLLVIELDERNRTTGPFTRTIERNIRVSYGDREESFSAGRLAANLIRNGDVYARKSWVAELKSAGF